VVKFGQEWVPDRAIKDSASGRIIDDSWLFRQEGLLTARKRYNEKVSVHTLDFISRKN
jgi:hypothetical protein